MEIFLKCEFGLKNGLNFKAGPGKDADSVSLSLSSSLRHQAFLKNLRVKVVNSYCIALW